MRTRVGFGVASVAALVMCSCSSQLEAERARAEAEAAREKADIEMMNKQVEAEQNARLEAAKAAEKTKADEAKQKEAQKKTLAEVQKRWNATAGGVALQVPNLGQIDFQWDDNKFPHPTFKGGSAEAYGAFAAAFLSFLQKDDNFDYLAKNNLFYAELRYAFPNGMGEKWTFAQLANQFSQPKAHGDHDDATRKALKEYAEKMKKTAKE